MFQQMTKVTAKSISKRSEKRSTSPTDSSPKSVNYKNADAFVDLILYNKKCVVIYHVMAEKWLVKNYDETLDSSAALLGGKLAIIWGRTPPNLSPKAAFNTA